MKRQLKVLIAAFTIILLQQLNLYTENCPGATTNGGYCKCICSDQCPGYITPSFTEKGAIVDTRGDRKLTIQSTSWCYYDEDADNGQCDTPPGPKLKKQLQDVIKNIGTIKYPTYVSSYADDPTTLSSPISANSIGEVLSNFLKNGRQITLSSSTYTASFRNKGTSLGQIEKTGIYTVIITWPKAYDNDPNMTTQFTLNVCDNSKDECCQEADKKLCETSF